MNKRNIFIIIPTTNIGGSEKRIIGFWLYVNEHFADKIKLIIRQDLFEKIKRINELKGIEKFPEHIIFEDIECLDIKKYTHSIRNLIKKHVQPNDVLHFISTFPYLTITHNKTIFSFTESSLNNVNYKGKIVYYLSFLSANRIDVLDPIVYDGLSHSIFFKRKISLTPNSYVDPDLSLDIDFERKKNQVTHLGRFHKGKFIDKFIKAFPVIDSLLRQHGINDVEFLIIGSGALEPAFKQILAAPEFANINYRLFFTENPHLELKTSKIILSIQEYNNYPSKSLLEGIVCGNIPLVTDVGTTRKITQDEFSYFLDKNFTGWEMAGKILEIIKLDQAVFKAKAQAGISFVKKNFTIEKMAQYYLNLYKN